jgi:glyoxylase-like metal-dependent hydrolase (beta-lactamase superfamily II)
VIVRQITVGAFQENCYLVVDESSGLAVLIDPGDDGDRLLHAVEEAGATLDAIWLTHAHVDHVGGIAAIRRRTNVPICLHPLERPLYDRAAQQAAAFGLPFDSPPPPDQDLADGDTLSVGQLSFDVMHTPGHAPGLVVIHGHGVAFVGDLLFAGSIGRTDLPLADPVAMSGSLERVCTLPPETVVYPGHGPATTIARERAANPFLTGSARVLGGSA